MYNRTGADPSTQVLAEKRRTPADRPTDNGSHVSGLWATPPGPAHTSHLSADLLLYRIGGALSGSDDQEEFVTNAHLQR